MVHSKRKLMQDILKVKKIHRRTGVSELKTEGG